MAKEFEAAYSRFMHPRNRHQNRYDLKSLTLTDPRLTPFIIKNKYGDESIDFSNKDAVKALNRAILRHSYDIAYWDLPAEFLCPPIPGRADTIHSAADLFSEKNNLHVLDIGTGANCIYPLLGNKEYNWTFVASDINPKALQNAQIIVEKNHLSSSIELRLQTDQTKIFTNVLRPGETFDLTLCNPPFHASLEEATKGTERKWKNLGKASLKGSLNFGGQGAELWCPGGEKAFIFEMIHESVKYQKQVKWFTTLVSKEDNVKSLSKTLEKYHAKTKILEMTQGQKVSRLLCWSF